MALKGYATNTEVAALLGYDSSDTALMADINVLLGPLEEEVDMYCDTTFQNETGKVRYYSGNATDMISLGYYLRTLTSVYLKEPTGILTQFPDVVGQPSEPRCGAFRWIQRQINYDYGFIRENVFPQGLNNIQVTGDWGFVTIPSSIKWAIALSVKHMINMRDIDTSIKMESSINRTVEFNSNKDIHWLHPMAMKLLSGWINTRALSE